MFEGKRETVIPKKEKDQKEKMRSTSSAAITTRSAISVWMVPISPLPLLPLFLSSGHGKHFPQHSSPRNDAKLLTGATRII